MIISKKAGSGSWLFTAVLSCLLMSLSLTSCDGSDTANTTSSRAQPALHLVEVVTVESRAVSVTQSVSGALKAVTKVRLFNEESGRITQLPYHEGDTVKKGTLLVQLDNALLKTDVAKAKANKEQAQLDLSRQQKLLQKNLVTEEELARTTTALHLAIAEKNHQLIRLQRTSILAPIDGVISKRLYEPGDMLAPQSHIHTLIDPSALRLHATLAERWLPLVTKDQPVSLSIDALGDRFFPARILRIHPTVNPQTHQGIIEILLSPVPEGATVGQFSRASIELNATNRLVIPVHTIHYEPAGAYVFRVINDSDGNSIIEKVHFKRGQQFVSVAEVLSELQPGDQIVSRGFLGLRDGKKVNIANVNEPEIDAPPASVAVDRSIAEPGNTPIMSK